MLSVWLRAITGLGWAQPRAFWLDDLEIQSFTEGLRPVSAKTNFRRKKSSTTARRINAASARSRSAGCRFISTSTRGGPTVAGLFAAAMDALSSAINATAAIAVSDFQSVLQPSATTAEPVRLARWATLVCSVLATRMAAWLAWRNVASLWDEFLKLTALIGGGFPGGFALGLLTKRANAPGVIGGAPAAIAVTRVVQTYTATSAFLQAFVAIASCMAIGYAARWLRAAPLKPSAARRCGTQPERREFFP